jgi:hypothetical protein
MVSTRLADAKDSSSDGWTIPNVNDLYQCAEMACE